MKKLDFSTTFKASVLGIGLLWGLTACGNSTSSEKDVTSKPDKQSQTSSSFTPDKADNTSSETTASQTDKQNTENLTADEIAKRKAAAQAICNDISESMAKVDNSSKITAIQSIQNQLEECLPYTDNQTVLQLLQDYQAMYDRFLYNGDEVEYTQLYDVTDLSTQGDSAPKAEFAPTEPRLKYLTGLIEKGADVRIKNIGEGFMVFDHNLKAMVDIFAPYMQPDERAFTERMAKDNQEEFMLDAMIAPSFNELVERAIFWEDYIKRYPNGYAVQDAKILLNLYRRAIIYGSDNSMWTDDSKREFAEPKHEHTMKKLAQREDSILAEDAQKLLEFMALSDSERQEKYPVVTTDAKGNPVNPYIVTNKQLDEAFQIPLVWDMKPYRECLEGVMCTDG